MRHALPLFLAVMLVLSSCEWAQDKMHRGHIVARIGWDVLYSTEIENVIPSGVSTEDSLAMASQYMDSWALRRLLTRKAEKDLSKSGKDVSRQVEEFRNNLLGYRYEKYYIDSRLDTTVTAEELKEYYDTHSQLFKVTQSLVKARVITVLTKSPYFDAIKKSYMVTDESAIAELEELCDASAERYTDFEGAWVPATVLAKEAAMDVSQCEKLIASKSSAELKDEGITRFVFVRERISPGNVSPLEYNVEHIREIIISKRKQELLSGLERDLLNDAKSDKTLRIYE